MRRLPRDSRPAQSAHDCEQAVIGACLVTMQAIADVRDLLLPSDFEGEANQRTFAAILSLFDEGTRPDVVSVVAELAKTGYEVDPSTLLSYASSVPSLSMAPKYAEEVVRTSQIRRAQDLVSNAVGDGYSWAKSGPEYVNHLISALDRAELAPRTGPNGGESLALKDFLEHEETTPAQWLIPGMLRQRWRVIFVAPEGVGKAVLLRQIAIYCSEGLHPFSGEPLPRPLVTLYVDLENPADAIRHQSRLSLRDRRLNGTGSAYIWSSEAGLNLRSRRDQSRFEAAMADVQPDLVCLGPLYKTFRKGGDDHEDAATEVAAFLDDMRVRYNSAMLIEHHAPHGNVSGRDIRPKGSSVWMAWPELGIKLIPQAGQIEQLGHAETIDIGYFRGKRVETTWPTSLRRGGESGPPWVGTWPTGTFNNARPARP